MFLARQQKKVSADSLYQQGRSALERGELTVAEELANQGYKQYGSKSVEWSWRFRVLSAEALVWRGISKDALPLINEEPPASLSFETLTRRKLVLGLAECFLQHFEEADRLLAEAAVLASEHQPVLMGDVFLAQGVTAVVRSNYPLAEQSFQKALSIGRSQNRLLLQASALGNLGIVSTRTQRYDEAIDRYAESLRVSEALGNRASIAKVMGNLGWCYLMLGDLERAQDLLQKAERLSAELGSFKDQQVWLANLGTVYSMNRQYEAAEEKLREALDIARKLQNKALEAITLNEMTRVAITTKNFKQAAEYNAQAEQLNRIADDRTYALYSVFYRAEIAAGQGDLRDAEQHFQRVINDSAENLSLRWEAQAALAKGLAEAGLPMQAEGQFRKALAGIDEARSSLSKEEYRLSFLNTATEFYDNYIDFLISRGRIEDALAVAEHSRAQTLAEGLGIKSPSTGRLEPSDIARRQGAVILAYWLKPERSYLWAITAAKIELFSLPADSEINALVRNYRKALTGPRDPLETANPSGQELYKLLVGPAEKLIAAGSRVVVIAEGSLHELNFETLLATTPKLHYWIEDVTIRNANSLLLLGPALAVPDGRNPSLLLIGNPVSPSSEFPALEQADEEMRDVVTHFDHNRKLVIEGANATPDAYLASSPERYSYIHFVAHATASRLSPLDSAVVLSRRGDAYKLYAREIVQKPLTADLVTISACYGSGNRAYSGEGLVGLSWAFLRAGARNVIAALWEANDASTPQLMDTMYNGLSRGEDPATALRTAKLEMMKSNNVFRRPFYWAPFQLYVATGFNGRPHSANPSIPAATKNPT
ncbi:MAG TPA: CHAT domain-containing protein [Terriglobales bacterium]|nr:CHAT domain-containing protein [Terriglobales bacterium]